jgi:hypothetical protein
MLFTLLILPFFAWMMFMQLFGWLLLRSRKQSGKRRLPRST